MNETANSPYDTVVFARWIIPIEPAEIILENHALAVKDGRIAAIAPAQEARDWPSNECLDLANTVLLPGLINCHGHSPMSLFRGMADDHPLDTWLNDHIWPAEGKWVDSEFVRDGSQLAMAEMILSGTTCFTDMYFFPETIAKVAQDAGMRAMVGFPILDFPTVWGSGPDEYLAKGEQLRDDWKHSQRINICYAPHAPYTVSDDVFTRIATYAHETDANIHIHAHEAAHEVQQALKDTGKRPLQRLADLGILGPRTQCAHLTQITAEDIELLATHNAHGVHCPKSNLKLASGFSPVQSMKDAGINIALGTDGAASNNTLDLFAEMHTAALLAKAVSADASALNDFSALKMATLDGARALGLEQSTGSLEIGKYADMIAVDLSQAGQQPVFNPMSQLVYTQPGHCVTHSWVQGKALMRDRTLTTLDSQEILQRANHWRQQIQENP